MTVEVAVFRGENRVRQGARHVREADESPVLDFLAENGAEQLGLDDEGGDAFSVGVTHVGDAVA